MYGGVDGNLGFQHTADHALHAEALGGRGDFQGVVQTAALHELNINEVRRPHLHDGHGVLGREHRLVRQHRHVAALGNVFQALKVVGLDGLLHKLDVQPLLLHFVQDFDRFLGPPGLIGVDADDHILTHCPPDCCQPGHIQLRIYAHLHFQTVVAPVKGDKGILYHRLRVVDGDGNVRYDFLASAAHELVDRNAVKLTVQIP